MSRVAQLSLALWLCAGCTLISLEPLQSESGGSSAQGGAAGGGGGSAQGGAAQGAGGTGSGAGSSSGGGGGGGASPVYDACVLADMPSLYLRMTAGAGDEPNLGSLGGSASLSGAVTDGASLVSGGDGARVLGDGMSSGAIVFDAAPVFAGGLTSSTIELWFEAPSFSAMTYPLLVGGSPAVLTLRIEARIDPMGLDVIHFIGRNGIDSRFQIHPLDLLAPPGQIHHLVLVYRQSAATMFQNGASDDVLLYLDGELALGMGDGDPVSMAPVPAPLTIGSGFDARLDELAVYPFELSAARIAAHFAAGSQGTPCP